MKIKTTSYAVLFCGSLLTFVACKKEAAPQTNNTSGGNTNGNVLITSSNATSWYAMFQVDLHHDINTVPAGVYNMVTTNFYKTPQQAPGFGAAAMVDSIFINSKAMMFAPFNDSSYIDTTGLWTGIPHQITYPYTFRIVGSGVIPTFSYTENGPFPDYSASSTLPDTIHQGSPMSFSLANMVNSDYALIYLSTGMHDVMHTIYPPFPLTNVFSVSELSVLDTGNVNIQVTMIKMNNKSVGGKPMLFTTSNSYTKTAHVKP